MILCACGKPPQNYLFDMGSERQAAAPGYTRITPAMQYNAQKGFGWLQPPASTFDTINEKLYSSIFRSGVWAKDSLVFRANLPAGDYFMILSLGCKDSVDLKMAVAVDHRPLPDTISTPLYRLPYHTLRRKITVNEGNTVISIKGQGTPVGLYALEFRPCTRNRDIQFDTPLEEDTAVVREFLQQPDSNNIAFANQADMCRKYLLACKYFEGGGWSWAVHETGLSLIYRMNAAADLLEQVIADVDDPLYNRALYLLARTYYWLDQEDDNSWQQARARELFKKLQQSYPDNDLLKMYTGQKVADKCNIPAAPQNAPLWAAYQREVMYRLLKIIHWWVGVKQTANGEMGGKYGDDVEMLRWWLPPVLGADDSLARVGYTRLADGVWNSGVLERGFAKRIDDVEHAAELFRDTHPGMFLIRYGDPEYVERCLTSMQNFRDVWTSITSMGHRHFRSYYLSATAVSAYYPYDVDVAMNARALLPGLWAAWYNNNPALIKLLSEWGQAWITDANRATNGKPAGVIPSAVAFQEDRIGGHSPQWYNPQLTYTYYNWDHLGHVNELQYLLAGLYALTQKQTFLQTINTNARLMTQPLHEKDTTTGSLYWVQQQLLSGGIDHAAGSNPMGKLFAMARQLSNSGRYDTLVDQYGAHYNRYTLHHDKKVIVQGLEEMLNSLRYNFPLLTSEVKFTDRVYIPNNSLLSGMYLGHFGAGYEYPSLLASWKNTGKDVAILVNGGDQHFLQAALYNFGQERSVQLRTWQLQPGRYCVSTGLDKNGDDSMDEVLSTDTISITERVKDVSFTLPGKQLLIVTVKQLQAYPGSIAPKADPGLTAKDIVIKPGAGNNMYVVQITLHNIGNAAAENSRVKFYVDEVVKDSTVITLLEAPDDMKARTQQILFQWKAPAGKHLVRIKIEGEQPEITKLNNEAALYFTADDHTKE